MKDTTTTIDEILEDFNVWCLCESRECQRSVNFKQAKQALLQWHKDKARSYVDLLKSDLQKFEELWEVWGVEYGIDFNMEAIEQTLKAIGGGMSQQDDTNLSPDIQNKITDNLFDLFDSKQDDELRKQIYKELYGIYQSPEMPERTKQVDNVLETISTHYIPKAEVLRAIGSDDSIHKVNKGGWRYIKASDMPRYYRNVLRASIRKALGLTSKETEE